MQLQLLLQTISDKIVRENFFRLKTWLDADPLLQCDFRFFEVDIASAQVNFPIRHGLKFIPQDILMLSADGNQNFYFQYGQFDSANIYVTTSGPVRLRFVAGNYTSPAQTTSVNYPFVGPTQSGTISALTGDVTASGSGSVVATISANAVSNAKLAQMAARTIKGNNTGSTANASDLSQTQVTALLNQFTSTLQGVVPSSGGGTTNFLRADGTWAVPFTYQSYETDTSWDGVITSLVVTVSGITDARKAIWQICDNANNYERIWCSIKATSSTQVTITMSPAPPAGSYRLLGIST